MDLQSDQRFAKLGVEVLSIAPDPPSALSAEAKKYGITAPFLSDAGNQVAQAYGVMRWAVGNEPGHTFVLVDASGRVRWIRDYGAPENGGLMYVSPDELFSEVASRLQDGS